MSDLQKLLEKYLLHRHLETDSLMAGLLLAREYRQRKMDRHFHSAHRKLRKELEGSPFQNERLLRVSHELTLEELAQESVSRKPEAILLERSITGLDQLYFASLLRLACVQLTHKTVFRSDFEPALLPAVLEQIEKQAALLEIPAIGAYYYAYSMLRSDTPTPWYPKFRTFLQLHDQEFPASEIRDLFLLAVNFCIRQINTGKEDFFREAFETYREGIEKGHLLEEGRLSRFTYSNVVAIGIQLKEYTWVESFLHRQLGHLDEAFQESAFSYNRARLAFALSNYDEALIHLQKAEYQDLLTNLGAKTLQLKIYFEKDEWDLLYAHLDAMKNFINRNKVLGYHRENYWNIVKVTNRLSKLNPYDQEKRAALRQHIQEIEHLTERKWLLEKLAQL